MQIAFDKGFEARIVSLDFSSAFDSVNHAGLLFKLQSIGVGCLLLNILKQFLLNRQQRVAVDGFYSTFTTVRTGVSQGSFLGPFLYNFYC